MNNVSDHKYFVFNNLCRGTFSLFGYENEYVLSNAEGQSKIELIPSTKNFL